MRLILAQKFFLNTLLFTVCVLGVCPCISLFICFFSRDNSQSFPHHFEPVSLTVFSVTLLLSRFPNFLLRNREFLAPKIFSFCPYMELMLQW